MVSLSGEQGQGVSRLIFFVFRRSRTLVMIFFPSQHYTGAASTRVCICFLFGETLVFSRFFSKIFLFNRVTSVWNYFLFFA